jgi:hypothetical protein
MHAKLQSVIVLGTKTVLKQVSRRTAACSKTYACFSSQRSCDAQCTASDRYENEDKPYLTYPTNLSGFEGVLTIVPPHPSFSKAVPHWINDWQASIHTCTKASQYCDHLSHTNKNFPRLMDAIFFRNKCALMAWITWKEPGRMTQMPCPSRCFKVEAISISICSDLLLFKNKPFAAGCKILHHDASALQWPSKDMLSRP